MTRSQLLAQGVLGTRDLTARFFTGFDDTNHTKQAPGLPNHFAWNLGHLAAVMSRVAERLDGVAPSAKDFAPGMGTPDAFGFDAVGMGSNPLVDKVQWPSCGRCLEIFNASIDRLVSAVSNASDAKLDEPTKWGAGEISFAQLIQRMVFHNGMHAGQITDLRRALGMDYIMGKPRGA